MKKSNIFIFALTLLVISLTSPAMATVIDLGAAGDFAVLATNSTSIRLKNATITGNIGISNGGSLTFETYSVTGDIYIDSGATIEKLAGDHIGIVYENQDLSQALADAALASATAASLTATQTFSKGISDEISIIGNGGINVININGIDLSGSDSLNLVGGADDVFILNILAGSTLNLGNSSCNIQGVGVLASNILINILGDVGRLKGNIDGTILALGKSVRLENTLNSAIIAGGIELAAESIRIKATITNVPLHDPILVPEPMTALLLGLGGLIIRRKTK